MRRGQRAVSLARFDVLLTGRIDAAERDDWLRALRDAAPDVCWWSDDDGEIPREAIEAAVVANPAPGLLQGLPRLRLVQSLWAGVENLLADTTLPAQVPLARMVDPAMSAAMAETALWAVLSLQRRFFDYAAQQAAGEWRQLAQRRADDVRRAGARPGPDGRRGRDAAGGAGLSDQRVARDAQRSSAAAALRCTSASWRCPRCWPRRTSSSTCCR